MKEKRRRNVLQDIENLISTIGKYLGLYSTVVKVAQLAPILLGLLLVFFSPSAWLSTTLRQWAVAGVVIGGVAGMVSLALAGWRHSHKQGLATVMLLVFLLSAAVLRLHLALVDVAFVENWSLLRPLQDWFLGSDTGELTYNALTSLWFGLTLFSATLGLPLYVIWRTTGRRAGVAPDTPVEEQDVRMAVETLSKGFDRLRERVAALKGENRRLRDELEVREALIEQLRPPQQLADSVKRS
jgi:hypothetical protein